MANSAPVVIASNQSVIPVSATTLENMVDQLATLVNSLKFLSALQTPTAELRVSLNGLANNQQTIGAISSVTNIANQTGQGGFQTQHVVMSQMNTAANQLRSNITVT